MCDGERAIIPGSVSGDVVLNIFCADISQEVAMSSSNISSAVAMSSSSIVDTVFKDFLEHKLEGQSKDSKDKSSPDQKSHKKDHKSRHHKKHKKHKSKEKEGRHELKQEGRHESRQEGRQEGKQGARHEGRHESRQEARHEVKQEARDEGRHDVRDEARHKVKREGRQEARHEGRHEVRDEGRHEVKQEARQEVRQEREDYIPLEQSIKTEKSEKSDSEKQRKKEKKHKKHKHKDREKEKSRDRSSRDTKDAIIPDNSSTFSVKVETQIKSEVASVDEPVAANNMENVVTRENEPGRLERSSNDRNSINQIGSDSRKHGDRDLDRRRRHKHKKHKSREKDHIDESVASRTVIDLTTSGYRDSNERRGERDLKHHRDREDGQNHPLQQGHRDHSMGEQSQPAHQVPPRVLEHLWAEDPSFDDLSPALTAPTGGSAWMILPKELEKNADVNASTWMRLPKELENDDSPFDSGDADLNDFSANGNKAWKTGPPSMVPPPVSLPKLDVKLDMSKMLATRPLGTSQTAELISRIQESVIGDIKREDGVICDIKKEETRIAENSGSADIAITDEATKDLASDHWSQTGDAQAASTAAAAQKKAGFGSLKLGIKISETSAALIASGEKVETDPSKQNMEDGEVTDSSACSSSDSVDSADDKNTVDSGSDVRISELSSSGQVTDSEPEHSSDKKKKKKEKKKKKKKDSKKRKHSKSRSRSPKKHKSSRSRSRTRAKSFDENKGVWRSISRSRSRSRSRGQKRSRSRDRHRRRSRDRDHRQRSRDRHYESHDRYSRGRHSRRSRSRSRSRSPMRPRITKDLRVKIDKAKLRQIAFQNAFAMQQSGMKLAPDQVAALKAGGKSVEELTDFCKKISEKDTQRRAVARSSDESDSEREAVGSDEEPVFINHPFNVKEAAIVMNIRNSKPLPILSKDDKQAQSSVLRLQFPVSSGSHHRDKESTWVPVEKTEPQKTIATPSATNAVALIGAKTPTVSSVTTAPSAALDLANQVIAEAKAQAMPAIMPPPPVKPCDKVFPDLPDEPINIGEVVSSRLSALRKLQCNPHDVEAMGKMYKINEQMSQWAHSKNLPGMFTGSTGAVILSQSQLSGIHQVWSKKDQLKNAAPVSGGIGRLLLQRMGWKEGEGLGKEGAGNTTPLMLDIKVDRKGLTTQEELVKRGPARTGTTAVAHKDLSGKHPVSALVELCNRKKWGAPNFILIDEAGPDHKKNFKFKVVVNNTEYQAASGSTNKKQAKAAVATICLQELGLVPR